MTFRSGIPILGFTITAAVVVGCASDSLTLPREGDPASINIVNGNGQQGMAGSLLDDSLVVSILDGESRPVVNRSVSFNVTSGGAVQPGTITTNGEGKGVFRWVLGPSAGQQTLDVGLGAGSQLSPKVTFVATAIPGPVQVIAAMSGDGQSAPVGSPLPQPLVVRLQDSYGNGVPGASVIWQASAGNLSSGTVVTGDDGSASVTWTLGQSVGEQTATARFQGASGSPTLFTATATPGASPRLDMVTQPSATTQSGVPLAQQPSVRLETAQGNPIQQAGVAVTAAIASGGGSLGGTTTVQTNGSGVAQFTDLAIVGTSGTHTLIFATAGHTPAISAPVEVITPGPSWQYSTANVPNGKSFRWTTITITTRDDLGNPINRGGYASQIRVSVSGSNNNGNLTVFDQGDGTYEASYFPLFKGTDLVSVTITGTALPGSPFQSKVK